MSGWNPVEGITRYSELESLKKQRDAVAATLPGLLVAKDAAAAAYETASANQDRVNINRLKQEMHDAATDHFAAEQQLAALEAQVTAAEAAYNK